jgi:hypothetical protein
MASHTTAQWKASKGGHCTQAASSDDEEGGGGEDADADADTAVLWRREEGSYGLFGRPAARPNPSKAEVAELTGMCVAQQCPLTAEF